MSSSRSWRLLGCLLLLSAPIRAAAQARIFPDVQSFELPEASPRVHGLVGRIFSARRGDSDFGPEPEAEVAVGENFPVLALRRGERPVTLGFGTQVYGRFSLGDRKSALISNDWVVGINTTAVLGAWTVTGEVYHESSHLGDEYSERFSATRLDWTREVAAAWLTYGRGPVRITGNLSYVLIDELGLKRPGAALAADYEGRPFGHFFGGPVRPVGGIFFQGEAATDWRISTSAKLGIAVSRPGGRREIGLALIAHDGLSTQRQFFRHESRYIGGELRFDL
ncbi:MAG TPA: DUF1207 domain-containing protein [Gemmatimonadales bacterium]|nr:DUF1207 domain-containing protein [Gemmatimonadales bacterium]